VTFHLARELVKKIDFFPALTGGAVSSVVIKGVSDGGFRGP
jgi:hypothetical protein